MIPYGRHSVSEADIAAVVAVLRSDWLTQGEAVGHFEEALTEVTGARYAVAFANGTAALHGACAAADLGAGSRVATTPLTFVASANCARYVGAEVDLVDIDPGTLNLDLTAVPRHVDALVAVHYAGLPVALDQLASRPRIVIEDAAHAIGATTPSGPVGNCANSDMAAFSFHPVKTITSAEGGAVTTNSPELAARLRQFRSHCVVRPDDRPGWHYEVVDLGFNYRLSDVHAALGLSQTRRLAEFVDRRNELAARYRSLLADLPVTLPPEPPADTTHGRHLFPVRVAARDRVFEALRDRGIGAQVHYIPVYRHPLYAETGRYDPRRFPHTEAAFGELLSLPLFPDLTEEAQDRIVVALAAALAHQPEPVG